MVERRVAGTRTSAVDAEGSRRRESTSDSGWINSGRYCGAATYTITQSHWMRSGTRSQSRFTSSGVIWSNLHASAVSRALIRIQKNERHGAPSCVYVMRIHCVYSLASALLPFWHVRNSPVCTMQRRGASCCRYVVIMLYVGESLQNTLYIRS